MPEKNWDGILEKVDDLHWQIPKTYREGMRVPGMILASSRLLDHIRKDQTPLQVANVAHLPGICKYSLAMPDIHWGYGLPIGGVAAVDAECGVISPGGVGSDINCGVRLVRTNLDREEIGSLTEKLVMAMFSTIPCGVGSSGKIRISYKQEEEVLYKGARWAVEQGYGWAEDLEFTEEQGGLAGADPEHLSVRARKRGLEQLGTLGSGNHFLEIQVVETVFDAGAADSMGLREGQVTVMIHSGSRGLGYQVCEDYMKGMGQVMRKYNIDLPDRQLGCAPIQSPEGQQYLGAMAAAANYAWANRQCIMHQVREVFGQILRQSPESLGMGLVYDVAHNIAKFETHGLNGNKKELCIHRKGATRAFGPGHPDLPEKYKAIGQPIIIPGDMGTASYVLTGTQAAMEETFGSTCHGAGRNLSRHAAIKQNKGRHLERELAGKGICIRSRGRNTLLEECPEAYKNIDEVVDVIGQAGISRKTARLRPVGVIKG